MISALRLASGSASAPKLVPELQASSNWLEVARQSRIKLVRGLLHQARPGKVRRLVQRKGQGQRC